MFDSHDHNISLIFIVRNTHTSMKQKVLFALVRRVLTLHTCSLLTGGQASVSPFSIVSFFFFFLISGTLGFVLEGTGECPLSISPCSSHASRALAKIGERSESPAHVSPHVGVKNRAARILQGCLRTSSRPKHIKKSYFPSSIAKGLDLQIFSNDVYWRFFLFWGTCMF